MLSLMLHLVIIYKLICFTVGAIAIKLFQSMDFGESYGEAIISDNFKIVVVWSIKQEKENLGYTKTL